MKMKKIKTKAGCAYQTRYSFEISASKSDPDYLDSLEVVQEENIDRKAIKIKFYLMRWRTPQETIALLKKIIDILESYF